MAAPVEKVRTRVFSIMTKGVLGLSIPAYLVALFINRELNFLESLQIPIIAASILVVLASVERIERRLSDPARAYIKTYKTHTDFYVELRAKVDQAERRVFTSYLRPFPPETLGSSASNYFATCRAWAARSDRHHFRRVVLQPQGASSEDWLRQELEAQRTAPRKNYQVRMLDWSLRGESEAVSVALIDDQYLFFAFSGEQDKLVGFSISSKELVDEYFVKYHENLWSSAKPIAESAPEG